MSIPMQGNATALGADFVEAAERALCSGILEQVPDAELERVMTAAVRRGGAQIEPGVVRHAADSGTKADLAGGPPWGQLQTYAPQHAAGSVRLITVASVSVGQLWLVWLSNDGYPNDRNSHQHYPQDRLDAEPRAFHVDIDDFVEFCLQR